MRQVASAMPPPPVRPKRAAMERLIQVSKRRRIADRREVSHPADFGVLPLKRFFCANNGDYKEKWRKQHAWKQPYLDHRRRPGSYCLDHLDRFGDLGHLLRVVRRSPGRSRPGLLRAAALWALSQAAVRTTDRKFFDASTTYCGGRQDMFGYRNEEHYDHAQRTAPG